MTSWRVDHTLFLMWYLDFACRSYLRLKFSSFCLLYKGNGNKICIILLYRKCFEHPNQIKNQRERVIDSWQAVVKTLSFLFPRMDWCQLFPFSYEKIYKCFWLCQSFLSAAWCCSTYTRHLGQFQLLNLTINEISNNIQHLLDSTCEHLPPSTQPP